MAKWQFCFIDDTYYEKFPSLGIMENKHKDSDGKLRDRPCFFAFEDATHKGILGLILISSQYEKYKTVYDLNIAKYGRCSFELSVMLYQTQKPLWLRQIVVLKSFLRK